MHIFSKLSNLRYQIFRLCIIRFAFLHMFLLISIELFNRTCINTVSFRFLNVSNHYVTLLLDRWLIV